MTVKQEIENLRKQHSLVIMNKEDMRTAIEFVSELIEIELAYDKEKFPNATVSHRNSQIAYQVVRGLEDFINES